MAAVCRSGSGTTFLVELLSHETGCSVACPCSETQFLRREELTPAETFVATCKQETTLDPPLAPAKSEKLNKAKAKANVSH